MVAEAAVLKYEGWSGGAMRIVEALANLFMKLYACEQQKFSGSEL
jgi:hypothetical protein